MAPKWKSSVISSSPPSADQDSQSVSIPCSGWYGLCFHVKYKCDCVYAAHETSKEDDKALLTLPHRVGRDIISSLEIGTLIYLRQSANVTVSLKTCCDQHNDQDPSCEWCLFLQCEGKREEYSTKKTLICAECCRMFASMNSVENHIGALHKVVDPNSIWKKPLKVVYEDEFMAVIDKPQGMTVMGDKPSLFRSDLLLALAGNGKDSMAKPVYVHRLDAATGGLLVLAKTKAAEIQLKSCFASRSCRKTYLALALGRIEPEVGTIEEAISGKPATTHYKVVQFYRCVDDMADGGWVTLVDLHPVTGRNHQLRRHLKHIGHPIWGDKKYAPYRKRKAGSDDNVDRADVVNSTSVEQDPHCRLCLWSVEITFPHPETEDDLTVSLGDRPEWLACLLAYQEKRVKEEEKT